FTRSRPEELYALLLETAGALLARMGSALPAVTVGAAAAEVAGEAPSSPALDLLRRRAAVSVSRRRSFLLGWTPRLHYFPARDGVTVVEAMGAAWPALRAVVETLGTAGRAGESWLVAAGGFLFIASRQEGFTDLVALD